MGGKEREGEMRIMWPQIKQRGLMKTEEREMKIIIAPKINTLN